MPLVTDVSEKHIASVISVKSISVLGTALVVVACSVVLARATRRNIPEDGILHSHRRENLKSYINSVVLWRG
jgi:hypothetical protein